MAISTRFQFDKDNVKVELKDGYLTISAEKGLDKEDKKDMIEVH